jgi:hypothetical protein
MQSLLSSFGFSKDYIVWIMKLTSSSFFSILFNGITSMPFSPTRGICQGYPLSPFLFVIMVEGLGWYLFGSISNGTLQGIPIHGFEPTASQSQFVDDTILLNTPTYKEATKIQTLFSYFSEASDTTFNLEKSNIFFFNTPNNSTTHLLPPWHPSLLPSIRLLGITHNIASNLKHFLELTYPLNIQSPLLMDIQDP